MTHTLELCVRQRLPRAAGFLLSNYLHVANDFGVTDSADQATVWCVKNHRLRMLQFLLLQGVEAGAAYRRYVKLKKDAGNDELKLEKVSAVGKILEETYIQWKKKIAINLLDHFYHDIVTLIVGYHHSATWSDGFQLTRESKQERRVWVEEEEERDEMDFFAFIFGE